MAVKATTKSDLLQILIFTFFLCMLFFGAWGGYVAYQNKSRLKQRANLGNDIGVMEKSFRDEENKQSLVNYRRQKELHAGEEGSQLLDVINKVIAGMPAGSAVKLQNSRSEKKPYADYMELILNFGLEDCRLRAIVEFCDILERDRPDVRITDLKIARKIGRSSGGKGELEDLWSTNNFSASTYVTQEDTKKASEPKEE